MIFFKFYIKIKCIFSDSSSFLLKINYIFSYHSQFWLDSSHIVWVFFSLVHTYTYKLFSKMVTTKNSLKIWLIGWACLQGVMGSFHILTILLKTIGFSPLTASIIHILKREIRMWRYWRFLHLNQTNPIKTLTNAPKHLIVLTKFCCYCCYIYIWLCWKIIKKII